MNLKQQALKGMLWTFIQQMSTQGIAFIVSIILARILLPEEFGLIALLSVFIAIADTLINSGLTQSLIRTKNPDSSDFSTVFIFNMIAGVLMYGIIFFSAPFIAAFYNQPLLIDLTRIYCIVFIINAFSIIQNTKLVKELDFKKQTGIIIPSLIIGGTTGIILALNNYGVWSLVWSNIARSTSLSLQLWIWSPWKPSFIFSKSKIKQHLGFSYKLTIAGIIDTFFKDIYTIIIGKFFDPTQVGFYNRANTLRQLPVKNFSTVLNKVTFPLFSKIQNDDVKLKSAYKKIMQMSVFLVAPTLLFMAALAEPLFRFLLTEKWLPAVPYFQILCFNGILYPLNAYNLNILTVKGRSDVFLKLEIIKKILITIVVIISFQWGIYGLLYGSLLVSVIGFFINTYYTGKFINYNSIEQIKDVIPTLLIASTSAGFVLIIDYTIKSTITTDIFRLCIGSSVGVSIFYLLALMFKLNSLREIRLILFSKQNKHEQTTK